MKKQIETTPKARNWWGYCKHLRPFGKRLANKATRRMAKEGLAESETRST